MIPREVIGARLAGTNKPPMKVARATGGSRRDSSQIGSTPLISGTVEPQPNQVASPVVSLPSVTHSVMAGSAAPSAPCSPRPGTSTGVANRVGPSTVGNLLSLREKIAKFSTPAELTRVNTLSTEGMIDTFLEGLAQVGGLYSSFSSSFHFVYTFSFSLSFLAPGFYGIRLPILKSPATW